jgi:hypothetical protein
VELDKCLEAIKEHAFVSSPYPVILTLEDHLTPPLQAKVAKVHPSIHTCTPSLSILNLRCHSVK